MPTTYPPSFENAKIKEICTLLWQYGVGKLGTGMEIILELSLGKLFQRIRQKII